MCLIANEFYQFGPFRLEPTERKITKDAKAISLTQTELELLLALVEAAGRLCTVEQLTRRLWPEMRIVEPQNVSVHISRIRAALGDSKGGPHKYIEMSGAQAVVTA